MSHINDHKASKGRLFFNTSIMLPVLLSSHCDICPVFMLSIHVLPSGTGNTVIEAVRVLTEHGLQPKHIILLSLFSTPHGTPRLQSLA